MRASLILGSWLALLFLPQLAFAQTIQDYPKRPIRWIIPFPPGGFTEVLARMVGQKLTQAWGQTVVIDNRPGASSIVGTDIASKASPDGYTLLSSNATFAINQSMHSKLPYDALRDFTPVILMAISCRHTEAGSADEEL